MSESDEIWFQLIDVQGQEEPGQLQPDVLSRSDLKFQNIAAFKRAAVPSLEPELYGRVSVYRPGDKPKSDTAMRSGESIPISSAEKPLIVVPPAPKQQQQQQQQEQHQNDLTEALAKLNALGLTLHTIKESMPSVLVGHVVTPSEASKKPQAASAVFEALGLKSDPIVNQSIYSHADAKWNFSFQWRTKEPNDKVLESQSYQPVCDFLKTVGLFGVDVSAGQHCAERLLFNSDIYTCRKKNPTESGQAVFHKHRVAGRTDIVVLKRERRGQIMRHEVKFAIELKTVNGYQQSSSGCMKEAQLQLIGLNADNHLSSPPVVLSNLATKHQVFYLTKDEHWTYSIAVQQCETFGAAVHFAKVKSEEEGISEHFSRPKTPDPSS